MTVDELHQMYFKQLTEAFGTANALEAARDDRAFRALGNPDVSHSETEKAKVEY